MPDVLAISSEEEFYEFISQPRVVVNFTAVSWCAPCRALEPRFKIAAEQTSIPFATVDADEFTGLVQEFLVMSVPTVIVFERGNVSSAIGGRTPSTILFELE